MLMVRFVSFYAKAFCVFDRKIDVFKNERWQQARRGDATAWTAAERRNEKEPRSLAPAPRNSMRIGCHGAGRGRADCGWCRSAARDFCPSENAKWSLFTSLSDFCVRNDSVDCHAANCRKGNSALDILCAAT
mmetsp:Transcript_12394/g.36483  ORF Transcript_12394/g.36483 Transcript_12394/m.36483 type:complete len:132 (+) Transcript_12394:1523-1918(+)